MAQGQYPGVFFDGSSAHRRNVRVSIDAGRVRIVSEEAVVLADWPIESLQYASRSRDSEPLRLTSFLSPDARLVVTDYIFRRELLAAGLSKDNPRRVRQALLATLAVVLGGLALTGLILWAMPLVARPIAGLIPPERVAALGDNVVRQFEQTAPRCDNEEGQAAVEALTDRLLAEMALPQDVSVRVLDHEMINAFAAPGGRILIMHGLIDFSESPDELAGVLAHELGHVRERHPITGAVRMHGIFSILDAFVGDGSTASEVLSGAGGLALAVRYTRADEAEADRIAADVLARTGIGSGGLESFFERLNEELDDPLNEVGLSFLSTHPPLDKRASALDVDGLQPSTPPLTAAQWKAVRLMCTDSDRPVETPDSAG